MSPLRGEPLARCPRQSVPAPRASRSFKPFGRALGRACFVGAGVLAALLAGACGSTSTTTVGPTPIKCEVGLGTPSEVGAGGGTGTITVTTQRECAWTATTTSPWITRLTPPNGQGSGQIQFEASANPVPGEREAEVTVNDTHVLVRQGFSPCTFAVTPTATTVPGGGASRTITVATVTGCMWTATPAASWLSVSSGGVGDGNGNITIQAAANGGGARSGSVTVAGHTVAFSQSAAGTTGCSYSVQPTQVPAGASGDSGSVTVTSGTGCAWSAGSDVPWITIQTGLTGSGNGTLTYAVATNSSTSARTGHVTVEGQAVTINQSAGSVSCNYTIDPTSRSVGAIGGSVATSVNVASGCVWTAASNAPWLTIVSGATGNGNGSVNVDVASNTGPARSGTLAIAGRVLTVTQSDGCTFSLQPTQLTIDKDGGTSSVAVTAGTGCGWTASVATQSPWISVTSGASGNGSGTVGLSVAANSGPPRSGSVTIAGRTFAVNQVDGCAYSIAPTSQSVSAAGGSGTITVTAGNGCGWTASSNASFIGITSGSSGTGSGTVNFSVAANSGPARDGTLTVANQTFTVSQSSGCAYALIPTQQSFGSGGGPGSTTIITGNGCGWTVSVPAQFPWITITSAASGSDDGVISFSVAANPGPARNGTFSVEGQTFTVSQAVGCTYSIDPTSLTAAASAGKGTTRVTAPAGCTWTTTNNAPSFLTITSGGSGNGEGTTSFTIAANTGPQRSGTLTIAGQTFTVTQLEGCTYSINPTSSSPGPGATTGSTTVSTAAGCPWTATNNAPSFLTITSGGSGNGPGTTNFSIAANSGPPRSGTLTVAGQTFTVNQGSGCTYSINPTSQSPGSGATTGSTAVSTTAGCTWTATSNAPSFLTITSGASGNGPGTTNFSIAANTGPLRTGTLTVAGQTFTVTQASGCTFTINPTSDSVGANGGNGNTSVTASNSNCTWTTTNNAPSFLTITNSGSGTGNGQTNYSVAANTGPQRTGTLTVAGQTFTVTQANGCTIGINPTSATVALAGGTGSVAVTIANGCQWTAVASDIWITITSGGSGNGNGTINYSVAFSTIKRSGAITITVTGTSTTRNFAINQQ